MSPELLKLVQKNRMLFWDIGEDSLKNLDQEAVVERLISLGYLETIKELIDILGFNKVKDTYKKISSKTRTNLREETINYFNIYFDVNVPRYSKREAEKLVASAG